MSKTMPSQLASRVLIPLMLVWWAPPALADVGLLEKVIKCAVGIKTSNEHKKMDSCLSPMVASPVLLVVKQNAFYIVKDEYTKARPTTCEAKKPNRHCAEVDFKAGGSVLIIYSVENGKITAFESI